MRLAARPAGGAAKPQPPDTTPMPTEYRGVPRDPDSVRSEGVDVEPGARFSHSGTTTDYSHPSAAPAAEQHQVGDERQPARLSRAAAARRRQAAGRDHQ